MFMMNHKYQRVKKSAGGAIAGIGQGISSVAPLLNFIPGVGQLASPIASTVGNFLTLFDNGEFQDLEAAAGVNKMSSAPKTLADGGTIDGDEENPAFDISKLKPDEIKTLQEGLASLGYNVDVDGKLGPQTQQAWERFAQASREAQQKRQDFAGVKDEGFVSRLQDLRRDQYRMLGIPTNMNIFANDILDTRLGSAQHPIRNRDLKESEFEALQQAVRNASSRGSNKVNYGDYPAQPLGAISGDPGYSMKTLIGGSKIHVNPATGDTILADRYNYNYRGGNKGGAYGAARLLGSTLGSGPDEGYPVMINTSQFTPEQEYVRRLALHPQKREIKPPTKSQLGSTGRMYAQGGQLPNQNFHGGLLHFNGPSHAEGGIPFQGVEVEGGETNWKNYVFSDRLTLKDVKKKK